MDLRQDAGIINLLIRRYRNPFAYIGFKLGLSNSIDLYTRSGDVRCVHLSKERVWFECKGRKIEFLYNGTDLNFVLYPITEIFVAGTYERLGTNKRVVVDVGASVADSAIYFITRGALHVYGYEPDRNRYITALKNIELNGLSEKITIRNSAFDGRVPDGSVFKIDCEGCEYDLFRKSMKSLDKVKELIIEYHRGYSEIKESLTGSGFDVDVEEFSASEGIIYATRKE